MSALRIGVRIPPCDRVDRLLDAVRLAERYGFDEAWFPDSQLLWRDVFCALTAVALGTDRIAPFLALAGIELDVPPRIEGVYPDLVHAEDWERAVELCSPYVSDAAALRFAQEFCLFGTPAHILDRLAEVRSAGATGVFLQHVGSYMLPDELIEAVGAHVLPEVTR